MLRMPRAGAFASLAAVGLLLASTTAFAQAAANDSTDSRDSQPPYRLGTAARPFAWATAIGDLNADGRPDYAIADRVGGISGGFAYSLEVWIAGVGSQSVSFDAADPALAVSLLDVDHDRNLDVVVSAPMSRTVVRVWLNDGHGRFHEAASPLMELVSIGDGCAEPVGGQRVDVCGTAAPRRPDVGDRRAQSERIVADAAPARLPLRAVRPLRCAERALCRPRAPPSPVAICA